MSELTTTTAAARVVAAVKARGYWPADLPPWVIALRQIPKLAEELCEAGLPAKKVFGIDFRFALLDMAGYARDEFRDRMGWEMVRDGAINDPHAFTTPADIDWNAMLVELADVQVVIFFAVAAIMAHVNGDAEQEYDICAAAVKKAEADIIRGTK